MVDVARPESGIEWKVTNAPEFTIPDEPRTSGLVVPNQTLLVANSFVVQVILVVVARRFDVVTAKMLGARVSVV